MGRKTLCCLHQKLKTKWRLKTSATNSGLISSRNGTCLYVKFIFTQIKRFGICAPNCFYLFSFLKNKSGSKYSPTCIFQLASTYIHIEVRRLNTFVTAGLPSSITTHRIHTSSATKETNHAVSRVSNINLVMCSTT